MRGEDEVVDLRLELENEERALEILEELEPLLTELEELSESGFAVVVEGGEANIFREFVISAYDEISDTLRSKIYASRSVFEASHLASCRNFVSIKDAEIEELEKMAREEREEDSDS